MPNDCNRQGEMRKWSILVTALHMTQWLMIVRRWQEGGGPCHFFTVRVQLQIAWLFATVILIQCHKNNSAAPAE